MAGFRILVLLVVPYQLIEASLGQLFGNQPGYLGFIGLVVPYIFDDGLHYRHMAIPVADGFYVPPFLEHVMGIRKNDVGEP